MQFMPLKLSMKILSVMSRIVHHMSVSHDIIISISQTVFESTPLICYVTFSCQILPAG